VDSHDPATFVEDNRISGVLKRGARFLVDLVRDPFVEDERFDEGRGVIEFDFPHSCVILPISSKWVSVNVGSSSFSMSV
jgi:hypothetical protein